MIERLDVSDAPALAVYRKRQLFDAEGNVTGTEDFLPDPAGRSCRAWFFETVGGKRLYINADTSPFIDFPEGTDMGSTVGYLSKVNPVTDEVIYGGRHPRHRRAVRGRELLAWMVLEILIPANEASALPQ